MLVVFAFFFCTLLDDIELVKELELGILFIKFSTV